VQEVQEVQEVHVSEGDGKGCERVSLRGAWFWVAVVLFYEASAMRCKIAQIMSTGCVAGEGLAHTEDAMYRGTLTK
jgi:hypothetical protein